MARRISVEILGDERGLTRSFDRAARSAQTFSGRFTGVERSVRRAGLAIAAAGTAALGLGGAAVRASANFSESMQKVAGLSGVAQDKIAGLTDQVLQLAPALGKSPQELADALFFITSSGIDAAHAIDVLTVSAKASVAGLGETQTVADAVTSAINSYGAANISAKQATDVLVATVREGKGEASAFAGVIGNVTGFAAKLGVSFDQVGAALAAMTRLGTDARTTATQLQAIFSSLVKVSPKAEKAFASVGLNADDLKDTLAQPNGLLAFLSKVQGAFGDNTKAMAAAFPNIRALRGLFALVGKNADAVRGIFNRTADSSDSLRVAFGAVSEDTAQQFRKMTAAAKVAEIQIGAALSPLANVVAQGLTAATTQLTRFFNKLGEAHGFSAKIDIVLSSAADLTVALQRRLGQAIRAVDFGAVFARARGIADGFQAQLDRIDFGKVGQRIGDGISKAARVALPAAKDIAQRITAAVGAIDFVAVGRKMGPGLAAAVVTAFVTLLDPAFWIKNWDLALAVAVAALPVGRLGKIAEELILLIARPLERFAPRLALALLTPLRSLGKVATGALGRVGDAVSGAFLRLAARIERFAPRFARAFLNLFLLLPRIVGRALAPMLAVVGRVLTRLVGLVRGQFNALNRITRFVVKVLGIQAVINAVVGLVRSVGRIFGRIGGAVRDAFQRAMDFAVRIVLEAKLKILKALDFTIFGHHVIPGIDGMVKRTEAALAQLEQRTALRTRQIQDHIDRLHGKTVTVTVKTKIDAATGHTAREGGGPSPTQTVVSNIVGATRDAIARARALGNRLSATRQSAGRAEAAAATTNEDAAKKAVSAAKKHAAARKAADAALSKELTKRFAGFAVAQAEAKRTKTFKDDLAVLRSQLNVVKNLLAAHKGNARLQREEASLQSKITSLQQKQQQALADATTNARTLFGTLFQQPTTSTGLPKTFLGGTRGGQVVAGGTDAGGLLRTITAQNKAFAQTQRNILLLQRRGAPRGLITAARAGELTPEQINVLAHANRATLNAIFRQFRIANRQITQAARADIRAQNVAVHASRVTINAPGFASREGPERPGRTRDPEPIHVNVYLDGKQIESSQQRRSKQRANQRRGRVGGHR